MNLIGLSMAPIGITPEPTRDILKTPGVMMELGFTLVHPNGDVEYRGGMFATFQGGKHKSRHINLRELFGGDIGKSINMLTITARSGYDFDDGQGNKSVSKDWAFCVDDIEVEFVYFHRESEERAEL